MMEKRDYLMDQIEQLGQALANLFAKLYSLRNQGRTPECIEMTSTSLKSELNLDFDELTSIPTGNFVNRLKEDKRLSYNNLERLADILLLIADEKCNSDTGGEQARDLYSKCLEIYNYISDSDLTFSFERQSKIEKINNALY